MVHHSVVDVISFHNVKVVPALEGCRFLLEVTVRRMWPPQLPCRLLTHRLLSEWAVEVRVYRVNYKAIATKRVLLGLNIQQSTMLIVKVFILLDVRFELNVPLAEELL